MILDEVCSIASKESKDKLPSFQRRLEEIHQESVNRGIGLQGQILIKIVDECNNFLAQEFHATWSRIEKALLVNPKYKSGLENLIYDHFIEITPRVEEVTAYFDGMPESTGQPQLIKTIEKIRDQISDKRAWLAKEKKEEARLLAVRIRNNQISIHDKWLNWCKDKPAVFVTYYVLLAIGAINGLVTSYDFISKHIQQYFAKP